MAEQGLPLNRIIQGDCIEVMQSFPEKSIDLVFADPPYNLQLKQDLLRPNQSRVDAVNDSWDRFSSFEEYDRFSHSWLSECQRVLKDTGSLWVIGSYHNIYRIGKIIQDLGFWMMNDVVWVKVNPMPNFRGVRFANAHETLIWSTKFKDARYTFNHHAMKAINDGKQMRSDWDLRLCKGSERIRINGNKVHTTQKPESLLYRVIQATSRPGDTVLDPFFGTGTTGAVAKKLHRKWIGIEQEARYITVAQKRIDSVTPEDFDADAFDVRDVKRTAKRVAFSKLLEAGYIQPGQVLYFRKDREQPAKVRADGKLNFGEMQGSIHQVCRQLRPGQMCNGWDNWYYEDGDLSLRSIDHLRQQYREDILDAE